MLFHKNFSFKILCSVFLFIMTCPVSAQIPDIMSFSPTSGPVGSTVTIMGGNFSTTPANNIVWFGAVRATVTAATDWELKVTVPTGATYQPISVTVNGLTACSGISFEVTFSSKPLKDPTAFAPRIDFVSGNNPEGIAICDIDGDGKSDLVVANGNSNSVSVYRNNSTSGSILPGSFDPKVDFQTGSLPRGVAAGDINGDGKPDIITANTGSGNISVLRNTSTYGLLTAGSFQSKVDFSSGNGPIEVIIGDVDTDGKPDIIATNWTGNTVSVFRNNSTTDSIKSGSFLPRVEFYTGSNPVGLALNDINHDRKPDLIVANNGSKTLSIFTNKSSPGIIDGGSFFHSVDYNAENPWGICTGDIDGDTWIDLIITNNSLNTISIYRNTSTTPLNSITASTFAPRIDLATGSNPDHIAIGDLDGDSRPDIAVTNFGLATISLFKNNSSPGLITSGSFSGKIDLQAGTNPRGIAIGDIDGDIKPEVIVVNNSSNTISVFQNLLPAPVPPVISSFTPGSGPVGTTVTITGTNFDPTPENNIVWFGAVKATVTASTSSQLIVTVPAGATYQPITVTVNGLTGYSAKPFNVTFPSSRIIGPTTFATRVDFLTANYPQFLVISDIDGDGKADLVMVNADKDTISIMRNTSNSGSITTGSFTSGVNFTAGTSPFSVAAGDLDGDGKQDLAVVGHASNTISVYRNISTSGAITTSSFAAKVDFTTGANPVGAAIRDIDGDGKPDLAVANFESNTVSVFRNKGTPGSITSGSFASRVDFITGTNPNYIAINDLDGDGRPEIAVTNEKSNTVSIFRNTCTSGSISSGSFADKVDFTTGTNPSYIIIGDIDGDEKPDLIVANRSDNSSVSVIRNTCIAGVIDAGSFSPRVDFTTGVNTYSVSIGDLNGDGKPDLAAANFNSPNVSILTNISSIGSITTSSFAFKVDIATGMGPYGIAIGDLDGDGKPDLTNVNYGSNTVSVLRNTISLTNPPIINSFSPTSGPIGTTVTISGSNFSTTPANNIVFFGAVKANVTNATATQLTMAVPNGATYQPITVTVDGLTAYSGMPFIVTFAGSQNINASSLSPRIDLPPGSEPFSLAVSDIDTDGIPDLVFSRSSSSNITILRNISTSGSISGSSFASGIDFAVPDNATRITSGDLDGDGKPDLVVKNGASNLVSVFRNTSTSGSISTSSLAPRVDFTTGSGSGNVAVSDMDGDGKSDLMFTNPQNNNFSILRNTATTGTISSGSFAVKVDFATGDSPWCITSGDLDNDGKPDVIVTSSNNNIISVFRNTSTAGVIDAGSFASGVSFPSANTVSSIAVADIDGDGKNDIVATNNGSNNVSLFRNMSSQGSVSFSGKIDFATGQGPNKVSVGDMNGDGKPDLVVACSSQGNAISVLMNTSSPGSLNFASIVELPAGGSTDVAVGDLNGDGKPEVSAASHIIGVFNNLISETSPPVITSFSPASGPQGSTVTIIGSNFDPITANDTVWFGNIRAEITSATSTQLTVIVPAGAAGDLQIFVSVNGMRTNSDSPFNVTSQNNNNNDSQLESSVLTLNNDGINDNFRFRNFESYGNCKIYIYNSRGVLIYSDKNFQNDWNLSINGGPLLQTGAYFYILETDIGIFQGSFSVLRQF